MKARTTWKEKMKFLGEADGNSVLMDAKSPIGSGTGLTPKELVAIGLAGCSAMDVVALMKKHKQPLEAFDVDIEITTSDNQHPAVFKSATLTYYFKGDVAPERAIESVKLSQTKYCGVSAMLSKAFPISYKVVLNDNEISTGEAYF